MASSGSPPLKVAVVWRGDAQARAEARPETSRFAAVFAALERHGLVAEPAVWVEGQPDAFRAQLLAKDAALVWVNPVAEDTGDGRAALDAVLREVAAAGVLVSGHPDVIDWIGTKEVLVRTREMGWGTDTHLYASHAALAAGFPGRVAEGPRVLKRSRGNGGIGVWKVECAVGPQITVQEARDRTLRTVTLDAFLAERAADFAAGGTLVDQPFQTRHLEGMVRCYVSDTRVAGFGCQFVTALAPPEHAALWSRCTTYDGVRRRLRCKCHCLTISCSLYVLVVKILMQSVPAPSASPKGCAILAITAGWARWIRTSLSSCFA